MFKCWKFGVCRSMGCKVTGRQTFRMIGSRLGIEPGQTGWLGPGPAGRLFLRPPTLTAGNFAALWPTDPKFSAFKNLNPFKILSKVQEATIILRVTFALSKWPHLHRAYVVGGCLFNFGTVGLKFRIMYPLGVIDKFLLLSSFPLVTLLHKPPIPILFKPVPLRMALFINGP